MIVLSRGVLFLADNVDVINDAFKAFISFLVTAGALRLLSNTVGLLLAINLQLRSLSAFGVIRRLTTSIVGLGLAFIPVLAGLTQIDEFLQGRDNSGVRRLGDSLQAMTDTMADLVSVFIPEFRSFQEDFDLLLEEFADALRALIRGIFRVVDIIDGIIDGIQSVFGGDFGLEDLLLLAPGALANRIGIGALQGVTNNLTAGGELERLEAREEALLTSLNNLTRAIDERDAEGFDTSFLEANRDVVRGQLTEVVRQIVAATPPTPSTPFFPDTSTGRFDRNEFIRRSNRIADQRLIEQAQQRDPAFLLGGDDRLLPPGFFDSGQFLFPDFSNQTETQNEATEAVENTVDAIEELRDTQIQVNEETLEYGRILRGVFSEFGPVLDTFFDRWKEIGNAGVEGADALENAWNDAFDRIAERLITLVASQAFRVFVSAATGVPLTGSFGRFGFDQSSGLGSFLGGLFGAQRGASVILGGRPGIDSNVLSDANGPLLRYSAGERLDITPAGRGRGDQKAPQINNFEISFAGNVDEEGARRAVVILEEELPSIISNTVAYNNVARPQR